MRNAKQFLKAIKASIQADPTLPVRFDIVNEEQEQITKAFAVLTAAVTDRNAPRSAWDWRLCVALHADPEKREQGFGRVAFFGPDCPRPKTATEGTIACYTPGERDEIFCRNANEVRWLEPDAKRGKKQVATLRAIAKKGGKASPSKYNDGDIEKALIRYRRDNPNRTLWDACNALIRTGKELSKYKHVNGLLQRVKRMDKARLDIGAEAFFDSL